MRFFAFLLFSGGLFSSNLLVDGNHVGLPKIVGGHDTNITEVPYYLLHMVNGSEWAGAVIIGPREVLTAGHCFSMAGGPGTFHQYRAGSDQLNSGGKVYTVESYVIHPGFNMTDNGIYNDIALARVTEPFEFSETVQPINLAKEDPKGGDEVLLSGFGYWKYNISGGNLTVERPQVLQSVVLPVVDRPTCREWYSDFVYEVMDNQICAGLLEGGHNACNGDSGGPMVFNNELVGVTSWGLCFDSPHHPSVYTSVAYYSDWIEETLNSFN